jgi:hypothetical protein
MSDISENGKPGPEKDICTIEWNRQRGKKKEQELPKVGPHLKKKKKNRPA